MNLSNPNIPPVTSTDNDVLYHLGLSTHSHDLPALFGDVKFVCMGGTVTRMRSFIQTATTELDLPHPGDNGFVDYTHSAGRYSMFKSGPILAISHGIGFSSISVVLHELFKLLYYSRCSDVTIFRIGTCGGIGVEPGSVIVTRKCVDGLLRGLYELPILGKLVQRETVIDQPLCNALLQCSQQSDDFDIISGTTMSTSDFYEGQGRLDGAICGYGKEEKLAYLHSLREQGVVNIEMEAIVLASMSHLAKHKVAVVCVALLDRLQGDQVKFHDASEKGDWERRAQIVVIRYIKKRLLLPANSRS